MLLVQNFVERLRPLAGHKSWDYIVLWKLSDDHRNLELMYCICAGTGQNGDDITFHASSVNPCRDVLFSHPRNKACDFMDHVPSSVKLDSGVHAEVFLSNQSCWLNFSYNSDSNISEETIGTRVLVPLPLGLLELFVAKQVPEDQGVLDYIKTQCNIFLEQHAITGNGIHEIPTNSFSSEANIQNQPQISQDHSSIRNLDLPNDVIVDRIHISTPPFNQNKSIFVEGTYLSDPFTPSNENGFHEMETAQGNLKNNASSSRMNEKMSFMEENNEADDSDPNDDDENDGKYRKRTGKGNQCKNLEAERKRRKKLNDRLYCLRALVPNISKLDRSAILGDAIDYVKELQKQVKDLQLELEEHSDDENTKNDTENGIPLVKTHQNGIKSGPKRQQENIPSGFHSKPSGNSGINTFKKSSEVESINEKVQQMEPQVEVYHLDGNEFFVKVFCEHKPGGFLKLMEALDYLGLEVSNVNATRHTCLVSNIFKVEIRESETVQADYVKESLLELTRNPLRVWPNFSPQPQPQPSSSYDGENRCQMNSHHLHLPHH